MYRGLGMYFLPVIARNIVTKQSRLDCRVGLAASSQ